MIMLTKRFHGVTSLLWVGIAVTLAAIALFSESVLFGAAYLAICAGGSAVIVYAFCAKCPCKAHCGHVFPGKAAMRIQRAPGPYTAAEIGALGIALALILGLPQIWLWEYPALFIVFWALVGIGLVQIRVFVCRACQNVYCPLKLTH
jgi:hypothetical protein